jgi:dihydroorotase
MEILIQQATIINSASPFNGKIKDILIVDGAIALIADAINQPVDIIVKEPGLFASIGWIDTFADFCDPGYEYKETLETGAAAAAAGGFTHVMIAPNTQPAIHSKSQVEYIIQKSKLFTTTIHPIGAITKNTDGKELAEMYDMMHSGALAFSDGCNTLQNAGTLLKALQYVKAFDGTIIQIPCDKNIAAHGLMNEGIISTQLGLPGIPAIAEELMIARDIKLAAYTNSKLHFTGVSTKEGVKLIQKAKEEGIEITCSVTPYHLYFCDEDVRGYDTNLKVNPPLRNSEDKAALQQAFKEGLIDCIASHHTPQSWDGKTCEFEYAKNGMIGLESLFGVLANIGIEVEKLIYHLTTIPRKIFNLPTPVMQEGQAACITLFNPNTKYIFTEKHIQSKSKNSPFIGKQLKGKVIGIINNNRIALNEYK